MEENSISQHADKNEGICKDCAKEVDTLEARTFKTYQARLRACVRLQHRARAWNALMIPASLAGLIASAVMLRDPKIYGDNGDLLWLVVAIITFAGSLITSSLNYSGRSRDMFINYRKIQSISAEFEMLKKHPEHQRHSDIMRLKKAYNNFLDESENHTSADYYQTLRFRERQWQWNIAILSSKAMDFIPWFAVALPVLLIIPPVKLFLP